MTFEQDTEVLVAGRHMPHRTAARKLPELAAIYAVRALNAEGGRRIDLAETIDRTDDALAALRGSRALAAASVSEVVLWRQRDRVGNGGFCWRYGNRTLAPELHFYSV